MIENRMANNNTSPRILLSCATCTYSAQFLNVQHNNWINKLSESQLNADYSRTRIGSCQSKGLMCEVWISWCESEYGNCTLIKGGPHVTKNLFACNFYDALRIIWLLMMVKQSLSIHTFLLARGSCLRKAWRPLSSWPILIHFNFWGKPSLIIAIIFCMYPHSPNKLIATKYCFLIVRDDTSFVFSINYFSFLCSVELHCFIYFAVINFCKNYFIIIIIIILFINNVSIKIIVIFYVPEWSVFGFYDRRLLQIRCKNDCNKCTRLAIHTFSKCDHELKLENEP